MRRPAPRPLAAALADVAQELVPATVLARVEACWARAVGPVIAAEAEPVAERAGVLTVACRSAVWANELQLLEQDLLSRLNETLGGDRRQPLAKLRVQVVAPRR